MADRLQPILSLLDSGLSLYRRNFVPFALIAAASIVPIAIAAGALVAAAPWLDELQVTLLVLGAVLLLLPLLLYLIGALSRAAALAAAGERVRLREALAIGPGRLAGMGCFSVIYMILMQFVSSVLSIVCICPLWLFGAAASGLFAVIGPDSAVGLGVLTLFGVMFGTVYLLALIVGGASYSSMVYALQPWVQERLPFGKALERSLALIGYRFWRNVAAWALSALLLAAGGLTVTLAIGVLVPLPMTLALGSDSPLAQAISLSAWLLGMIVVLPPLPIWMALLYRSNAEARAGGDLEARVQAWAREAAGS
ncbi:MAG: hypothetical protein DIU80_005925 [Chloroflexota bacterium]